MNVQNAYLCGKEVLVGDVQGLFYTYAIVFWSLWDCSKSFQDELVLGFFVEDFVADEVYEEDHDRVVVLRALLQVFNVVLKASF